MRSIYIGVAEADAEALGEFHGLPARKAHAVPFRIVAAEPGEVFAVRRKGFSARALADHGTRTVAQADQGDVAFAVERPIVGEVVRLRVGGEGDVAISAPDELDAVRRGLGKHYDLPGIGKVDDGRALRLIAVLLGLGRQFGAVPAPYIQLGGFEIDHGGVLRRHEFAQVQDKAAGPVRETGLGAVAHYPALGQACVILLHQFADHHLLHGRLAPGGLGDGLFLGEEDGMAGASDLLGILVGGGEGQLVAVVVELYVPVFLAVAGKGVGLAGEDVVEIYAAEGQRVFLVLLGGDGELASVAADHHAVRSPEGVHRAGLPVDQQQHLAALLRGVVGIGDYVWRSGSTYLQRIDFHLLLVRDAVREGRVHAGQLHQVEVSEPQVSKRVLGHVGGLLFLDLGLAGLREFSLDGEGGDRAVLRHIPGGAAGNDQFLSGRGAAHVHLGISLLRDDHIDKDAGICGEPDDGCALPAVVHGVVERLLLGAGRECGQRDEGQGQEEFFHNYI